MGSFKMLNARVMVVNLQTGATAITSRDAGRNTSD